ncbi:MAG: hypothetical protein ACKO6Q_04990 [Bacteroidota bacterium]
MHFTNRGLIVIFILFNWIGVGAQTTSFSTDWGFTKGTFTKTTKIVDGERVTEGPFSYVSTDVSPSKMVVKGNLKARCYDGLFSMSWTFPKDGYVFSASGKFIKDTLDGVWNFRVKGAVQGQNMDRTYVLTFKKGILIKGDITNLLSKTRDQFATDELGYLHGTQISRENGYMVEYTLQYVHGVLTSKKKKDLASGASMKTAEVSVDTTIVNIKNYKAPLGAFQKGNETYLLVIQDDEYKYLFSSRSDLWVFVRGGYGEGWAPFLNIDLIQFPKTIGIGRKE